MSFCWRSVLYSEQGGARGHNYAGSESMRGMGAEKSQQCHKYFLHLQCICFRITSVSNMGSPNFLLRAPTIIVYLHKTWRTSLGPVHAVACRYGDHNFFKNVLECFFQKQCYSDFLLKDKAKSKKRLTETHFYDLFPSFHPAHPPFRRAAGSWTSASKQHEHDPQHLDCASSINCVLAILAQWSPTVPHIKVILNTVVHVQFKSDLAYVALDKLLWYTRKSNFGLF